MKGNTVLSKEASEIPSWTTMAGKQAHKSSPITAYSSEFLLSAALISPEPNTAATTCPWEDLTRSKGRFPHTPEEGMAGRNFISFSSTPCAHVVTSCSRRLFRNSHGQKLLTQPPSSSLSRSEKAWPRRDHG